MALLSMIRAVTGYLKGQNSFRAFPCQRDSSECSFFAIAWLRRLSFLSWDATICPKMENSSIFVKWSAATLRKLYASCSLSSSRLLFKFLFVLIGGWVNARSLSDTCVDWETGPVSPSWESWNKILPKMSCDSIKKVKKNRVKKMYY